MLRSGWICTRPARSSGAPSAAPSGDAATPAAHSTVSTPRSSPRPIDTNPGDTPVTIELVRTSTPSRCRSCSAAARRSSGNALRIEGPPSSSRTFAEPGSKCRKSRASELSRDLGERSGHLDPGRPAADHDERQQRCPLRRIALPLGVLEREQHAPPDLEGILQGLQARRDRAATRRVRSTRASPRSRRSGSRSRARRRPAAVDCPRGRRRRPRRAAPRRSSAGGESSGLARRCRPARAPPSPPGRATAGTRGGCADRRP